jgi:hypothetical protein
VENKNSLIIEKMDIPVIKKTYLEQKIAKMNRKVAKMGCEPIVLHFDNEHTITYNQHPITGVELAFPMYLEMVTAHLVYQIPIIEGYELIAKLDIYPTLDGGSEVMVSAVPDKDVPEAYKNKTSIQCDHCGWNRRRNHSVLLRNTETNEYKEVGSTCVKDFFGLDPKGFLYMAGIKFDHLVSVIDEDKQYMGEFKTIGGYDIMDVFATSAAAIAKWGWLSKGKAWELNRNYDYQAYVPTASHVADNLNPWPNMDDADKVHIEDEDVALAEKTFEYFTNLDPENNDYLQNCCRIMRIGYVPYKHLGIATSMVSAYNREAQKQAEQAKKTDEPVSEFQGEISQRLRDIRVTVTYKREFDNDYGISTLYAFKDVNGNVYKTWYSGHSWEVDVDEVVLITGTVKKHNTFKGNKETMLNRVAVAEAPAEAFSQQEFDVDFDWKKHPETF